MSADTTKGTKAPTQTCEIDGCAKQHKARGLCGTHYQRWRKHGNPLKTEAPNLVLGTVKQRFYSKIMLPNEDGCMLWAGTKNSGGYGNFRADGKMLKAHRVAYELMVGPIPDGLDIDHVRTRGCRSRACCAPEHLEPVTGLENTRRGGESIKTHCPAGHPYDEENTRIIPSRPNARYCKACQRERDRRRPPRIRRVRQETTGV